MRLSATIVATAAAAAVAAAPALGAPQNSSMPWMYRAEQKLPQYCQNVAYDFSDGKLPPSFTVSNHANVSIIDKTLMLTMMPTIENPSVGLSSTVTMGPYYMQFGRVSASIRVTAAPGAVHSFILIANGTHDGRDEIDFEFVGGDRDHVDTNVFSNGHVLYNTYNGLCAVNDTQQWHEYAVEWDPQAIRWYIDGQLSRVFTPVFNEQVQDWIFPVDPMHVSFGSWDASSNVAWAGGPIDWKKYDRGVLFQLRNLTVQCHSEHPL